MAPDRYQMTKIKKQTTESFRDYAQRWRGMAAQVNPPMSEAEMVTTFIDIQEAPYYERVMAGIGKPFAEMIKHGDMTEMGLKSGKIRDLSALEAVAEQIQSGNYGSTSRRPPKRNEEDVSLVLQGSSGKSTNNPPVRMTRNRASNQPNFNSQRMEGQKRVEVVKNRDFTPLRDPLEKILAVLLAQKKITELGPPADPKGRKFDPNQRCAYHSGAPGHDTQECWTLRHKIQNLIDSGDIVVEQQESPDIKANPLPEHKGGGVNAIETTETGGHVRLTYIKKVGEMIGTTSGKEKLNEAGPSQVSQPIVPFIDWADWAIPGGPVDNEQSHVAVIIGEIHNEGPPSVYLTPTNLTLTNWTSEPVIAKKG